MSKKSIATILSLLCVILGASVSHTESRNTEQLKRLKSDYEAGLIPEDIYREKVRQLLDLPANERRAPERDRRPPAQQEVKLDKLNGIWHVKTSNIGVFGPSYALNKEIGMVTWKLILSEENLVVLEHAPGADGTWAPVGSDPEQFPYQEMKVTKVKRGPNGEWITFRIDRSFGGFDAYESFELNSITQDKIRGAYRIYDPYGSGPGTGGKFSGTIRLDRYESGCLAQGSWDLR